MVAGRGVPIFRVFTVIIKTLLLILRFMRRLKISSPAKDQIIFCHMSCLKDFLTLIILEFSKTWT